MGFNDTKKILSGLLFFMIIGIFYIFFAEPMFFKKTEVRIDQTFIIPDISVDEGFFDKIDSLKNNTVTLNENAVVKNNPFSE